MRIYAGLVTEHLKEHFGARFCRAQARLQVQLSLPSRTASSRTHKIMGFWTNLLVMGLKGFKTLNCFILRMFKKRAPKFKQRQRQRPKSDGSGSSNDEEVQINRLDKRERANPNKQSSKKVSQIVFLRALLESSILNYNL